MGWETCNRPKECETEKYEMKEQTILNAKTTDSDHLDTHRLDTENDIKTILNNIRE